MWTEEGGGLRWRAVTLQSASAQSQSQSTMTQPRPHLSQQSVTHPVIIEGITFQGLNRTSLDFISKEIDAAGVAEAQNLVEIVDRLKVLSHRLIEMRIFKTIDYELNVGMENINGVMIDIKVEEPSNNIRSSRKLHDYYCTISATQQQRHSNNK